MDSLHDALDLNMQMVEAFLANEEMPPPESDPADDVDPADDRSIVEYLVDEMVGAP